MLGTILVEDIHFILVHLVRVDSHNDEDSPKFTFAPGQVIRSGYWISSHADDQGKFHLRHPQLERTKKFQSPTLNLTEVISIRPRSGDECLQ